MFSRLFGVGKPRLAVAFHESYILGQTFGQEGLFDPLRPFRIHEALSKHRKARAIHRLRVEPARMEDLLRVHPRHYLERARQASFLGEVFSMHRVDPWDTGIWEGILYATGGTLAAVDHARRTGTPAANLSGGFHHATPDQAAGFCVINDIAVAVAAQRENGFTRPIAVIDLDYHHGDGTEACLVADPLTWTFSLHPSAWQETGKREAIRRSVAVSVSDEGYLAAVREGLAALAKQCQPALVLYVAGVDPWCEDRLGDMRLSEEALLARDQLVRAWADSFGAALAIVTAGGYGPEAWRPTANFLASLLERK